MSVAILWRLDCHSSGYVSNSERSGGEAKKVAGPSNDKDNIKAVDTRNRDLVTEHQECSEEVQDDSVSSVVPSRPRRAEIQNTRS
ncbi:unnamed protein product [Gadus morhua 'NCC']